MRLVWILLILVFAAAGAIFGALNSDAVDYDFYFATLHAQKGAVLIIAVLIGWLLGGALVYFGLVLRLRSRLRVQMRKASHVDRSEPALPVAQTESATGNKR
jgi:putative membrane protein